MYIMITFGRFLAFMRLWVECIVVRPATIAIVALTFSIYAVKPFFPECDPPDSAVRMLAAVCIGETLNLKNRKIDFLFTQESCPS